jgi:hypothetical protein
LSKKLFVYLVILFSIFTSYSVKAEVDIDEDSVVVTRRTSLAIKNTDLVKEQMIGIYSWEENRHCSSFVSLYVKNLGIPVNWLKYKNEDKNPFPWSNTAEQVRWARENYPDKVHDSTLGDFLTGKLWNEIEPGDVVYLTAPIGHNGYNTYYHTAVLVGYKESGIPIFAEIASGIEASTNRTLEDLTSFYKFVGTEPFYIGTTTPKELVFTWIDFISIVEEIKENKFFAQLSILERKNETLKTLPHFMK